MTVDSTAVKGAKIITNTMNDSPKYITTYKGRAIFRSFNGLYTTSGGLKAYTLNGLKKLIRS